MYRFDELVERRNTGSIKWDAMPKDNGDTIGAWVADMDFRCAPEIVEALHSLAERAVFGYTEWLDKDRLAIQSWMKRRQKVDVELEWLMHSPGVVCSLNACVDVLADDKPIVIQPPVYPPFKNAVVEGKKNLMENPLIQDTNGQYRMDYDHLEQCFKDGAGLFILCNPHNPVGRVWTREELTRLGELCQAYDVLVISDDIHCDLILPGHEHVSALNIDSLKDRTVALISATKTFNLAGLQTSTIVCPREEWRKDIQAQMERYGHESPNLFAMEAQRAAYEKAEGWLDELIAYIHDNMTLFLNALEGTSLKSYRPEGTYLMWVDCRALNMDDEALLSFFVDRCGFCPNLGASFGRSGFIRVNMATPRVLVERIANGIHVGLKTLAD